jgi:RES domain-containing protein
MVYLASSRALAALEILVHLPNPLSRRKPYFLVEAQIPADSLRDASWAGDPASTGADWIHAESSLALRVPSVLVPEEPNYLLNPRHPDMREIRTGAPVGFTFDPRL